MGAVMIIRAEKNRNYTTINNTILNDERLSWKARGLAAYLLTKPDDWQISREHLEKQSPDGMTAVRSALKELRAAGYITSEPSKKENGRFRWDTVLHEVPQIVKAENVPVDNVPVENPPAQAQNAGVLARKPPAHYPPARNRTLVNTDEVSTGLPSTEENHDDAALTKAIVAAIEKAGIGLSSLLLEKYMALVEEVGQYAVIAGIERAVDNSKQQHFNYVAKCARTCATEGMKPKSEAPPKKKRRIKDPVTGQMVEVEI